MSTGEQAGVRFGVGCDPWGEAGARQGLVAWQGLLLVFLIVNVGAGTLAHARVRPEVGSSAANANPRYPARRAPVRAGTTAQRLSRPCGPGKETGIGKNIGKTLPGSSLLAPRLPPAKAHDFYFVPTVTAAEIYTDNVTLATDDNADWDLITEVTPGFRGCLNKSRVHADLAYQLQGLIYQRNTRYDTVDNHVAADATVALLPDHFFLDADTSFGQTPIDPARAYSTNNALQPGNRTNAWLTNLSPYWIQSLGPLGVSTLRYNYGKTIYSESAVADRTTYGAFFNLTSPRRYSTWSWNVNASRQRVTGNRAYRTKYFDSATLQLGYQLTRRLKLVALGGREDRYKRNGVNDRFGSTIWNAGLIWSTRFNTLELRYGHRFFGPSYYARATHRGRNFHLSITYREEPTVDTLGRLRHNIPWLGTFLNLPGFASSLLETRVFVRKRVTGTAVYETPFTRLKLSGFDALRDYRSLRPDERFYGGNLDIVWAAGARTTFTPGFRWVRREYSRGRTDDIASVHLSIAYQLTRTAQLGLVLRHQWRNSTVHSSEYRENAALVQVSKSF